MYTSIVVRSIIISITILFVAGTALAQCPTISVIGPPGLTDPGEKMTFRASVNAISWPRIEYRWSVDKGVMVEGQGTANITVKTDRTLDGQNVTATVQINGLPYHCQNHCQKTASGAGPVAMLPIGEPIDEWGEKLDPNHKRARLDAFFHEVGANPGQVGIVILVVTGKERMDSRNPRVQFILRHARFREFDASRIWFAFERGPMRKAVFWRMLPHLCQNCPIIKGGDLQ